MAAVLERFGYGTCEKFIQEVCWRTYWKGWLEHRPAIWDQYRAEVLELTHSLDRDRGMRERWEQATQGRTGVDCFDSWSIELVETGYLHNHTRMWFASIWIFTLGLPWALGADFFYRHLLDGDPASNTLSWRWVAGLQTRGKTYLARVDNIEKYTAGRFRPAGLLAKDAKAIEGPPFPPAQAPRTLEPVSEGSFGVLLTEEDLDVASLNLEPDRVVAVAGVLATSDRSPLGVGGPALEFAQGAVNDALLRARAIFPVETQPTGWHEWDGPVLEWIRRHELKQVVTPRAPIGPVRERLDRLEQRLAPLGVRLTRLGRPWDQIFWPFATSGFFAMNATIPSCLAMLGLTTRSETPGTR